MRYLHEFFAYARERQRILRRRRAGGPPPWTDDPVLREFRFCNVYREDDRVTEWFRRQIREPLAESPLVILATIAFRWFNFVPSGQALAPLLLHGCWNLGEARRLLRLVREQHGQVVTGAFVVHSPNGRGLDKVDGLTWCIDEFARRHLQGIALRARVNGTLEAVHDELLAVEVDSMGPFMAYEVVTDLRHTAVLRRARDVDTWASAGPGAARGLSWVAHGNLDNVEGYGGRAAQSRMLAQMRDILLASRDLWPSDLGPPWEMREVEHTLCEFDKYRRAQTGARLKRKFKP